MSGKGLKKVLKGFNLNFNIPAYTLFLFYTEKIVDSLLSTHSVLLCSKNCAHFPSHLTVLNLTSLPSLSSGPGPREAGRPAGLAADLPAAVLHPAGGARAPPHSRQQQVTQQQAAAPHDLRLAVPAAQSLRGPGL